MILYYIHIILKAFSSGFLNAVYYLLKLIKLKWHLFYRITIALLQFHALFEFAKL